MYEEVFVPAVRELELCLPVVAAIDYFSTVLFLYRTIFLELKTLARKGDWLRAEFGLESWENVATRCLSPFLADQHQLGWPVVKVGQAPKQRTPCFQVESRARCFGASPIFTTTFHFEYFSTIGIASISLSITSSTVTPSASALYPIRIR